MKKLLQKLKFDFKKSRIKVFLVKKFICKLQAELKFL